MVVNVAARFFVGVGNGLDAARLRGRVRPRGFAMWRIWRDEHSYGY